MDWDLCMNYFLTTLSHWHFLVTAVIMSWVIHIYNCKLLYICNMFSETSSHWYPQQLCYGALWHVDIWGSATVLHRRALTHQEVGSVLRQCSLVSKWQHGLALKFNSFLGFSLLPFSNSGINPPFYWLTYLGSTWKWSPNLPWLYEEELL